MEVVAQERKKRKKKDPSLLIWFFQGPLQIQPARDI
jgi:hypothetical protein